MSWGTPGDLPLTRMHSMFAEHIANDHGQPAKSCQDWGSAAKPALQPAILRRLSRVNT
jgi:hypothetical protein